MARTGFTGLDAISAQVDGLAAALPSGVSYDTTTPNGSGRSLKIIPASGSASSQCTLTAGGTTGWRRFFVRFDVLPTTNPRGFYGAFGAGNNIRIRSDGKIQIYSGSTAGVTGTTVLSTTQWYMFDVVNNSSTSNILRVRITPITAGVPGTSIDEITGTTAYTFTELIGAADTVADTYTAYFDHFSADSSTASPIGFGWVLLSLPISDNARAAKWTAGTSGTTNLFDAVDNLPPTGKVSPQTTTSAITHAGGGAGNEDYDANMTTYATLGIGAADTINAIQAIMIHGEDIATGTKTLTFAVKSNPAGSFETNFSAGADAGAVGTFPTNWTTTRGTVISSPSVTLANSPVMTARRPLTESRLADVCFMGLYIDYTPTIVSFIAKPPTVIQQSVKRASLF